MDRDCFYSLPCISASLMKGVASPCITFLLYLANWVCSNPASIEQHVRCCCCLWKKPVDSLIFLCIPPGRIRTRRQSSGSATSVTSTPADTRGRSRAKVVSQSQRKKCFISGGAERIVINMFPLNCSSISWGLGSLLLITFGHVTKWIPAQPLCALADK